MGGLTLRRSRQPPPFPFAAPAGGLVLLCAAGAQCPAAAAQLLIRRNIRGIQTTDTLAGHSHWLASELWPDGLGCFDNSIRPAIASWGRGARHGNVQRRNGKDKCKDCGLAVATSVLSPRRVCAAGLEEVAGGCWIGAWCTPDNRRTDRCGQPPTRRAIWRFMRLDPHYCILGPAPAAVPQRHRYAAASIGNRVPICNLRMTLIVIFWGQ